jgi:dimethylaniline monooxygenase (N-oxide forming)
MLIQKICVIGAGISGLVTAKTFIEEGYEVQVYEKQGAIGGVWEKSRRYPGVTTQTPGKIYTYPDYPLPDSYPEWPTGEQVNAYLESYANHFGVIDRIQFNTEVIALNAIDDGHQGWMVTLCTSEDNTVTKKFDFVVICNGVNQIPNIPAIPGIDTFRSSGRNVLHTTQVNSIVQLKDKRVVIVGFGKSACDIAMLAAEHASKCDMVFRQGNWKIPRFFFGLVNFKFLLFTRFAEAMTPKYKPNSIQKWLHTKGKPLVNVFWRLNEIILRYGFKLDTFGIVPEKPLIESIGATINIAPNNLFKYIRSQKIQTHKTSITQFIEKGVELASGEKLNADVIVLGTGFLQALPFLEDKYRCQCLDEEGYFHLYRNLIHPNIPNLAFVGYNTGLSANLTSDIGALWLVELVKGNICLSTKEKLITEMEADLEWRKNYGYAGYGGTCFFSSTFQYLDTLLHDMGLPPRQTGSFISVMQPLNSQAYSNVRAQLQDLHRNKNIYQSNLLKV